MKIQIDIDGELWAKFREKVHGQGKTLASVVPGVLEPALESFIECGDEPKPTVADIQKSYRQQDRALETGPMHNDGYFVDAIRKEKEASLPQVKRCELCDMPTDRLYATGKYRTCYSCWKAANKTAQSEAAPSASSSASSTEPLSKPQQ